MTDNDDLRTQSERQYQAHMSDDVYRPDPDIFHDGHLALESALARIAELEATLSTSGVRSIGDD